MPSHRHPTFLDYLVIAISPALIMLLVGSLVFFLLTAFYHGPFDGRLRFVAALFVLAAVLIGRISIEEGSEYATVFAFPLAIATWMALARFTDASWLFILTIIGVTWWSSHKLTWDCTVLDQADEASGTGLIDAAGFGDLSPQASVAPAESLATDATDDNSVSSPTQWKQWWDRWLERRKRPHPPGVWLIYFALVTLPLFAVGQWTIGSENHAATNAAFGCLFVYVASILSLMGTTSFLGIRRYLRQRNLEMPADMAKNWSAFAAVMVLAILLVCCLLPRPMPGRDAGNWSRNSPTRDASRQSPLKLDPVKSAEVPPTSGRPLPQETRPQPTEVVSDATGAADSRSESRDDQPTEGDRSKPLDGQEQEERGDGEIAGENQPVDENSSPGRTDETHDETHDKMSRTKPSPADESVRDSSSGPADPQAPSDSPKETVPPPAPSTSNSNSLWASIIRMLAGLGYGLRIITIVVVTALIAWRYGAAMWAGIVFLWTDLWGLLRRRSTEESATPADELSVSELGPPFASFRSPFQVGGSMPDAELIRYTFQALEAWAREHACARGPAATPDEFGIALRRTAPQVAADAAPLIQQYDCLVYGGRTSVDPSLLKRVRRLWQVMQA